MNYKDILMKAMEDENIKIKLMAMKILSIGE